MLVWALLTLRYRAWESEDGLIYLRYVANALAGHGFVYNPGEYVNGLTSALYGYLVLAVAWILGDVARASVLVSALASAAGALVLAALMARTAPRARRWQRALPALFLACSPYTYGVYGMEASLFAVLVGETLALHLDGRRPVALAAALSLTLLARPEGVFVFAVLAIDSALAWRRRGSRPPLVAAATPVVVLVMQLVANLLYYGAPLSASGVAKLGQGASGLWWGSDFVLWTTSHVDSFFAGSWPVAVAFTALVVTGIAVCTDARARGLSLAFMATLTAFYELARIPAQDWYYAPPYFFAWLYAGTGLAWWLARGRVVATVAALVSAVVIFATGAAAWRAAEVPRNQELREIGGWLAAYTDEDASVAMCEIGTVGWYSGRYVVDILGLVRPANAASIARGEVFEWLPRDRPDYILVHDPPWHLEAAAARAEETGQYRLVEEFAFSGYRLLARR